MADTRQRTTLGIRFRFLVRAIGLLGVLATAVAVVLTASAYPSPEQWNEHTARHAMHGEDGDYAYTAVLMLHLGVGAMALALVVELLGGLFLAASRRTATGTSALLATAAAIALLVFVNAYSLTHYRRFDKTREHQFTLPANVADDLRKLRPDDPTTIVVLQIHRTFGATSEIRDSYVSESEAKVAEKVQDLVDQFREFGPRFNVVVLDTEKFGYDAQLADLTKNAPELKTAIDSAPENSILFHANKRVQRLGFNEFLQLDKTSSKEANGGRGNLVLLPQGVENFARRILAVQERRPKVAVCVVHEWLTTQGEEQYTLAGLRKTLTDYNFDVVDIVLKKNWNNDKEIEPAAYTAAEIRLERLEGEADVAGFRVRAARDEVKTLDEVKGVMEKLDKQPPMARGRVYSFLFEDSKNQSWLDVTAVYRKWSDRLETGLKPAQEPEFQKALLEGVAIQRKRAEEAIAKAEGERRTADDRLTEALKDEGATQDRRIADVKTKFAKLLTDVDLLIVPRFTIRSVTTGREVPPQLHAMSKEQVEVVRDYMKSGRPVLALLGPISGPEGPTPEANDGFEKLLTERGFELGRDTIIFDVEEAALAAQGTGGLFGAAAPADIPPLDFSSRTDSDRVKPNPIGEALRITERGVEQKLEIRARALRPIYVSTEWQAKLPFAAEFVATSEHAWNELKPFPRTDRVGRTTYIPRYERSTVEDPSKRTHADERKASFPVAAAIQDKVPAEWFDEEYGRQKTAAAVLPAAVITATPKADIPTGRIVVFGHGGLFQGDLKPAQEKLLLHSVNWLVNRPGRLPTAPDKAWSYPRVELSERDVILWRWGTGLLMPLAVVILGLLAVMVRRVR